MRWEKKADPFYLTKAWKNARLAVLQRDSYLCVDCMAAIKRRERGSAPRAATVVHHVKPMKDYPELALDMGNLVSLCAACHAARHPEKGQTKPTEKPKPDGVRIIKV